MNKMDILEAITDLINLKIPRHRRAWKPFMVKYDCQKIAEIGVFEGENFKLMIEHNPQQAAAIDAWKNDGVISRNDSGYTQERLDKIYETFKAQYADKPFVKICREYSDVAARNFPDNYFDLIYIDADHTYEGCLKDIENWYPKVKKDRFLIGDDYWNVQAPNTGVKFGVIRAVNEFANANNLKVYELPRHGWVIISKACDDYIIKDNE